MDRAETEQPFGVKTRLLAAFLLLLAPMALHADPQDVPNKLTPAQEAEVVAVGRDRLVLGYRLAHAVRLRHQGSCTERNFVLKRLEVEMDPGREQRPGNYDPAAWRKVVEEDRRALAAEKARPCTPNKGDRALADELVKLPPLESQPARVPPDLARTITSGRYRTNRHGYGEVLDDIMADRQSCDVDAARRQLDLIRAVAVELRRRANAARAAGRNASVDPDIALQQYLDEQSAVDRWELEFQRFRAGCAQRRRAQAPSITSGGHPCNDPANAERGDCRSWAPLLGRWRNVQYGGVIELRLDPDGTMTGIVVTPGKRMMDQGFLPGMVFLRGFRLGTPDSVWSAGAEGGEAYSPIMPGRKPGEPYGTAKWDKATVRIVRARPGILDLPATIEGRMTNYQGWVR